MKSSSKGLGLVALFGAAFALFATVTVDMADARGGRGGGFGSRGSKTFSAPPTTTTAPKAAQPVQRSITKPGAPGATAGATAGAATAAAKPGLFGGMGMVKGLLLGGLIGAGLAGIFGAGALASMLGFLLQGLLIAGVVYLVISLFRRRQAQPAMATAGMQPAQPPQEASYRQGTQLGGSGEVQIGSDDYGSFERLLTEVQQAYGRNDLRALETRLTPEMLSYFAEELAENDRNGVRNEIGEVKLLQGDLSEAWREQSGEYATVAMRYSIYDVTVETATKRVLEGSYQTPQEVTEVWTFWRPLNGNPGQWELSAIQQTE